MVDKHDKTNVAEHDGSETNTGEEDILSDSQLLVVEEDVLEEAKEDQDLYDELDKISREVEESDKSDESNKNLVEKLERFKSILKIKERDAKGALEKEVKFCNIIRKKTSCLSKLRQNRPLFFSTKIMKLLS